MARTQEEIYSIGELAKHAGVTVRTVRYYCSEGLLPPPNNGGRYASYGEQHLCRLLLIARFKRDFLPLSEIKARMTSMTTAAIQALLAVETSVPDHTLRKARPHQPDTHPAVKPSVGDISSSLSHFLEETLSLSSDLPANVPERRRRVLLISPMLSPATGRFSDRQESGDIAGGYLLDESLGETWKRVPLAPGVELHFRLPNSPEEREALNRVIAQTQDAFKLLR
jgi:DNA-binding transcriptional MerR regulator